jgi:hypothetical protein
VETDKKEELIDVVYSDVTKVMHSIQLSVDAVIDRASQDLAKKLVTLLQESNQPISKRASGCEAVISDIARKAAREIIALSVGGYVWGYEKGDEQELVDIIEKAFENTRYL